MEPTAQGVLAKTPLAHMILYCLERKLRGSLVLRPEGVDDNASADVITIVDGFPAKVRLAEPLEHLGRLLLELGDIDDLAYNESLLALGRGEGLQGQILLKRGRIDAATLDRALRTQVVRKFGHLFGRPPSTRYAYYDKIDLLQRYGGPELFPTDPSRAIFANIRTNPSMAHADAAVERVMGTPLRLRVGADVEKLDLTRAERELLGMLKLAPVTPTQLTSSGITDPRSTKLFVYGLLLLKVIEPAVERAPAIREVPMGTPGASMPGVAGVSRPATQSSPGLDAQRRAETLASIEAARAEAARAEAARAVAEASDGAVLAAAEATNVFQKAEALVERGNLAEAEPFVNRAYELDPRSPDHVALWAFLQASKPERREAARYDDLLGKLEAALAEQPRNERARYYRGMILKFAGRMGDAIRDLREVVESNPRHSDAVREVRLYTMRQERDRKHNEEGSGSLLGKYAKRK